MSRAPVIDEGVARPGIEGKETAVRPDPGQIGDPSDVQKGDRPLRKPGRERPVVDRDERRPLPTRRHIGGAQVMHDLHANAPGKQRAKTKLDREAALRTMNDRLPMKADHIDLRRREAV
jgi:hypothetical protein